MRDFILVFLTFVTLPIVGCGGSGVTTKPPHLWLYKRIPCRLAWSERHILQCCPLLAAKLPTHGLRRLVLSLRDWNSAQALAQLRGRPRRMGHRVTSCFR